MDSPCIRICAMDGSGHCRGCRRSLLEIANWSRYSDAERAAIMSELPKRRVGPGGHPRSGEKVGETR